jgi:aryl-alcohol dehydrogenase-like predicted oxidoreductase
MNFRDRTVLGKTGLQVSRLGIGAGYGVPASAVEKAYHEFGINYMYWSLSRRGGMKAALRTLQAQHRDDLVIAIQSYSRSGALLKAFAERQISALHIDYADVLILGWFNSEPPNRIMDAALALKEAGRIRHIGMSGHHRPAFGELVQKPDSPVDIVMTRYNAAHAGAEQDIFPHLPDANRPGITTYTTTCWGKLLDPRKMPAGEAPLSATDCYRFALTNSNVDLAMCGPKNDAEMDTALAALDAGPLSDEEQERARRIGDFVHG